MSEPTGFALVSLFEGCRVDTYLFNGELFWRCGQIGEILDYANRGRRLATLITTEWREQFQEGRHYVTLRGPTLAGQRDALGPEHPAMAGKSSPSLMLTKAGLDAVLAKTTKPRAVRLRAFLEEEALPHVARASRLPRMDGKVLVVLPVPPGGLHARQPPPAPSLLQRALQAWPVRAAIRALLAEEPAPRGAVDRWYSVAELAALAGVDESNVSAAIRRLGIRGALGMSRGIVATGGDGKTILSFAYNPAGARKILEAIRETPTNGAA